jgi:hypothetical protein
MRARAAIRKLASLRPRDWTELVLAQGALLWAGALVATRPAGKLVHRANASDVPAGADPRLDARLPEAQRLARAVCRAARYGVFRPACLVRAIALHRLLRARGISGPRICIGVGRSDGAFTAHAWVQYGDLVLGDDAEHVNTFRPLVDVTPASRA